MFLSESIYNFEMKQTLQFSNKIPDLLNKYFPIVLVPEICFYFQCYTKCFFLCLSVFSTVLFQQSQSIRSCVVLFATFQYSYKKWKGCLEGSLDRVLFAAEVGLPKILAPSLPQNSSNINIKCARKLMQLYI